MFGEFAQGQNLATPDELPGLLLAIFRDPAGAELVRPIVGVDPQAAALLFQQVVSPDAQLAFAWRETVGAQRDRNRIIPGRRRPSPGSGRGRPVLQLPGSRWGVALPRGRLRLGGHPPRLARGPRAGDGELVRDWAGGRADRAAHVLRRARRPLSDQVASAHAHREHLGHRPLGGGLSSGRERPRGCALPRPVGAWPATAVGSARLGHARQQRDDLDHGGAHRWSSTRSCSRRCAATASTWW